MTKIIIIKINKKILKFILIRIYFTKKDYIQKDYIQKDYVQKDYVQKKYVQKNYIKCLKNY